MNHSYIQISGCSNRWDQDREPEHLSSDENDVSMPTSNQDQDQDLPHHDYDNDRQKKRPFSPTTRQYQIMNKENLIIYHEVQIPWKRKRKEQFQCRKENEGNKTSAELEKEALRLHMEWVGYQQDAREVAAELDTLVKELNAANILSRVVEEQYMAVSERMRGMR